MDNIDFISRMISEDVDQASGLIIDDYGNTLLESIPGIGSDILTDPVDYWVYEAIADHANDMNLRHTSGFLRTAGSIPQTLNTLIGRARQARSHMLDELPDVIAGLFEALTEIRGSMNRVHIKYNNALRELGASVAVRQIDPTIGRASRLTDGRESVVISTGNETVRLQLHLTDQASHTHGFDFNTYNYRHPEGAPERPEQDFVVDCSPTPESDHAWVVFAVALLFRVISTMAAMLDELIQYLEGRVAQVQYHQQQQAYYNNP